MEKLNTVLDAMSLVDYTGMEIKISSSRPVISDIPEHLINACMRISKILTEYIEAEVPIEIAYDLWNIHSQEWFCANFESIDGVSDKVILRNILGLLKSLNMED